MADRLAGKVAIVTGAGSRGPGVGNGKAAAILFAREGASVLCVDHVIERAKETCAIIAGEGNVATPFVANVTDRAQCEAMVAAAVERYGRLDILHNNVGIGSLQSIRDVTERRKAEGQLRKMEARYRSLVEGIPAVTFMAAMDEDANELYVSPQMEELLARLRALIRRASGHLTPELRSGAVVLDLEATSLFELGCRGRFAISSFQGLSGGKT